MTRREKKRDALALALDVQLLDVFAQVEALTRNGRELQRELLKVRGAPNLPSTNRRRASARILHLLQELTNEAHTVSIVARRLRASGQDFATMLSTEEIDAA
jgi:hypothetical protein